MRTWEHQGRQARLIMKPRVAQGNWGSIFLGSCRDGTHHSQVASLREQGGYRTDIHLKLTPRWYKFPGTSGLCKEQTKQLVAVWKHFPGRESGSGWWEWEYSRLKSHLQHPCLQVYLSIFFSWGFQYLLQSLLSVGRWSMIGWTSKYPFLASVNTVSELKLLWKHWAFFTQGKKGSASAEW